MAASVASVEGSLGRDVEIRAELIVPLGRVLALAYGVIGGVELIELLVSPGAMDLVAFVAALALVGVNLAAIALARSDRIDVAGWTLVAGPLVALTLANLAANVSEHFPFAFAVPVVLAGLLMNRRAVLGVAVASALLIAVFGLTAEMGKAASASGWFEAFNDGVVPHLSLLLAIALLASEYSHKLGSALGEAQRRARELGAAKVEIERKRDVALAVALEIQSMARELAATSNQQASGSSEQAAAMTEIVATMEELSRAAAQIAANSAHVSELSSNALRAAESGRTSVDEAIAGLDRIRAEVRGVAEKNLVLGQKTQAIGEIIEVIREIADRTHLLALNAAIESAAAGEYGRRFGVVASQVKELANESKSAVQQVRTAVAEIQRAASLTVLAAEKGEAEVEAGARLGRGAGDAISQIVESIEDVAMAAKEMLLATQQQQSASEQVVSTVREMDQVTRQSADGSRQIASAVTRLMSGAERLH